MFFLCHSSSAESLSALCADAPCHGMMARRGGGLHLLFYCTAVRAGQLYSFGLLLILLYCKVYVLIGITAILTRQLLLCLKSDRVGVRGHARRF